MRPGAVSHAQKSSATECMPFEWTTVNSFPVAGRGFKHRMPSAWPSWILRPRSLSVTCSKKSPFHFCTQHIMIRPLRSIRETHFDDMKRRTHVVRYQAMCTGYVISHAIHTAQISTIGTTLHAQSFASTALQYDHLSQVAVTLALPG